MLKELKENLNNQDNRSTAHPIFIVYDWERVPSHEDYTDLSQFIDEEGYIADTKEELKEWFEDNELPFPENHEDLDDYNLIEAIHELGYEQIEKVWYIKKRVFVNVFFTEASANQFIKQNHYNYTKEIHTYVDHLYRNAEMQYIRNGLKAGLFVEKVEED